MYNNVYQEYINNMLGTIPKMHSDFEYDSFRDENYLQNPNIINMDSSFFHNQNATNLDLERFYPDLYKLLYPMIQAACMKNIRPITEETIDEMVKEIYSNFNADDITVLNINLTNDVRSGNKTSEASKTSSSKTTSKNPSAETRVTVENEERNIRPNNYVLNDLIRILLIRELLGRPGNNRPPFRPGFPSPGPGSLPFRPRSYEQQNHDMYEHFNF